MRLAPPLSVELPIGVLDNRLVIGHHASMGGAFDYALARATPDVLETVTWLLENGATLAYEQGGAGETFGNVLLEFELVDARLTVTRDRSQWELHIQMGRLPRFDFEVIHRALIGDDEWSSGSIGNLAEQLPEGVSWRAALPSGLELLRSTADIERELHRLEQRRYDALLGPVTDRDHI